MADVLEGVDLSIPGARERVAAEMKAIEEADRNAAIARARELGLPLRREMPDGRVQEVAGLDEDGQILYRTTQNVNAAISTAANLVQAAPYNLTGTNVLVGVWDGGAVRPTHQEFGGRVTVKDGAANDDHATHVGGTIIASGVTAAAKGMATSARIDSYDWNSDITELTSAGAATAAQTNRVLVSNHSYSYISGWNYVNGGSPYRVWEWNGNGTGTTATEQDFGRYSTIARDVDAMVVAVPFTSVFWAAANDRTDNPSSGQTVALSPGSSTVVSYSSDSHPPGDGVYRNGYEIIAWSALGKNVVTIGAVNDAVSGGVRSTNGATMTSFSCWGPSDDGRIKPDLVANGASLYSASSAGDASYSTKSGTSMASPNAAGSAALVVEEHIRLFGAAARASTIKGLLIHTADDLGTAGPDYQNGWGLMNTKAAVDLVRDDATNPAKARLTENLITTSSNSITNSFRWDGVSPIRATLCWTDPAGSATSTSDSRTARLVNNLDLRVVGPSGATNLPYVMPFVGTWTTNAMSQAATTGTNSVDNVEQVYIAAPPAAGIYRAVVTYRGTLSGSQQHYSLLISGSRLAVPAISDIANQTVTTGTGIGPLAFTVGHEELPVSSVTVSASSSNTTLVPQANITLGGSGANRTITATPASGVTGSATITVTVDDGTSTASDSFVVTVNAVPDIAVEELRGSDSSSATVYNDGVFIGRNGGDGLGAWSGSATGAGGNYMGTTPVRARSFAIYSGAAGAANSAQATRALGTPLAVGESLAVQLGYTGVATGGEIGMNFFSGGSFRLGLKFIGGSDQWVLNAGGSDFGTGIGWAGGTPLQIVFRRNAGNGYSIMLVSGARSYSAAGLASTSGVMSIDSVQFYSSAQGANEHLGFDTLTRGLDVASASPFDLGSVQVGSSGSARTYLLRNDGGATLSTIASAKSGANPDDFVMGGTIPASLAAGAGTSFTLTFSPSSSGARSAVFSITSNDPDEGSVNFDLNGTGTQGNATVLLGNLSQTYDGTAREVSVATMPTGLAVHVTYNGSASAPTNAGTYDVVATVNDANYAGSNSATLAVAKAPAGIVLGNLTQTHNGTPRAVTVTTTPPGLAANITYDGSLSAPSAVGSYAVVAAVNDTNYSGSASGTLVISSAIPAFAEWISQFGGLSDATPAGDPDEDGMPNAMEYFLGTNPDTFGSEGAIWSDYDPAGQTASLYYRKSKEVVGAVGAVKWSTSADMNASWSTNSVTDELFQDHTTWELRRAAVPWLWSEEGKNVFLRLEVTLP